MRPKVPLLSQGNGLRSSRRSSDGLRDGIDQMSATQVGDVEGTFFAVWAPDAVSVHVTGDFNAWSKDAHPLRLRGSSGVWEGFLPGVAAGAVYKYFIASRFGWAGEKADPFALRTEVPPRTASVVHALGDPFVERPWRSKRRRSPWRVNGCGRRLPPAGSRAGWPFSAGQNRRSSSLFPTRPFCPDWSPSGGCRFC